MSERITTPASCETASHGRSPGRRVSPASPPRMNSPSAASTSRCTNPDPMNATGCDPTAGGVLPARQARRPRRLPVLDGGPVQRRHRRAAPLPGPAGPATIPDERSRASTASVSFPAYYLHIWDMFQRIPVYQHMETAAARSAGTDTTHRLWTTSGGWSLRAPRWRASPRWSSRARPTQPRRVPRHPSSQLSGMGFTPGICRPSRAGWSGTWSPVPCVAQGTAERVRLRLLRRPRHRDRPSRFSYTPQFERDLLEMPRVLAAFDSRWGDARTNITTYLQLYLNMDRTRQQSRRGAQRTHHRSVVRPLVPPPVALGVRFVRVR